MGVILHNKVLSEGLIGGIHTNNLKIGQENIEDLNKRFGNSLAILYNEDRQRYEPSDYTDSANYRVVDLLNRYVNWSVNSEKERAYQLSIFRLGIENRFDEIRTDLHYIKATNGLRHSHELMVMKFIGEFRDFKPKGLLSETELSELQMKLNGYCKELESEFLSDPEHEFYLESSGSKLEFNLSVSSARQPQKLYVLDMISHRFLRPRTSNHHQNKTN